MEVLATFGKMSKELFDYNRDIFKFDQMQRLQRDILRLDMQVARFELFREDIRDLVELTVGKMEMYHLVGALFLEFCVAFYVEGKIETTVPCFSIALYYLSVAGAFLYLVLAVWLSMFASISSHSFGVRLLCRFVRLPIPGAKKMAMMTSKLADFETERRGMMRIPLVEGAQNWTGSAAGDGEDEAMRAMDSSMSAQTSMKMGKAQTLDYLGPGVVPFHGGEEGVLRAAGGGGVASFAGEHVTLFRRLQAKWQCYDAYARVSMSLGANQILLSTTYYLINVTLVEYRSPTACYALIVVFQVAALALAFLDIAGLRRWSVVLVQAVGTVPCIIAAVSLSWPSGEEQSEWKGFEPAHRYPLAPICFFSMVAWLECLLWVAWPSRDEASLPRRFRTVLFLDVFGDVHYDPVTCENSVSREGAEGTQGLATHSRRVGPRPSFRNVSAADDACELAHEALRRWESLPPAFDIGSQRGELRRLRDELIVWRSALQDEVREHMRRSDVNWPEDVLRDDHRPLSELSEAELARDHFTGRLCGPVEVAEKDTTARASTTYYWDALERRMVRKPSGSKVLTLQEVAGFLVDAETKVRVVVNPKRASGASARLSGEPMSPAAEEEPPMRGMFSALQRSESTRNLNVPQRLPWRVLKISTRALQVAWFWQGSVYVLDELGQYKMDFMRDLVAVSKYSTKYSSTMWHKLGVALKFADAPAGDNTSRRLHETIWFEAFDLTWPQAAPPPPAGLRLEGPLTCLPAGAEGRSALLLAARPASGRSRRHFFVDEESRRLRRPSAELGLDADGGRTGAAAAWAALCPAVACEEALLLARPDGGGVALRAPDGTRRWLRVEESLSRRPWRLLAGAQVPCDSVADMLVSLQVPAARDRPGGWCLLLAGWEGGRSIAVAALPLAAGRGSMPAEGEAIVPVFGLPLSIASDSKETKSVPLAALSLEASSGHHRLWAIATDGTLEAWSLAGSPRGLGLRHPGGLGAGGADGFFKPTGVCEEVRNGTSRLNIVGIGGRSGPPQLYVATAEPTLQVASL